MTKAQKWQAAVCTLLAGAAFCAAEVAIADQASSYVMPKRALSGQPVASGKYGDRGTRLSGDYAREVPALEASGGTPPGVLKEQGKGDKPSPLQIGYGRDLPEEAKVDALAGLSWQQQADGSVTALRRVRSEGAVALRLGMKIAPEFDGELRFAPTGNPAEAIGPFTRRDWEGMEVYWSPKIEGDDMLVEIRMPDGKRPPEGMIGFAGVSHVYRHSGAKNSFSNLYPDTLPCHNEAACAKTEAERFASKATARMLVTLGSGQSSFCTGTLLNSHLHSGTPYFYTAHHCISDNATARTLQTFWNYQYPTCNGGTGEPSGATVRYGGADYLHSSYENDHALLRLREAPPPDAVFLGWTTDPLGPDTVLTAIHHPLGDVKKISWGSTLAEPTGYINVEGRIHQNLWIVWSYGYGIVQAGSSGSGLLNCASGECLLVGGLFSGDSKAGCSARMQTSYSKFSTAYSTALNNWLGSGARNLPILKVSKAAEYAGDSISSIGFLVQRTGDTSGASSVQYAATAGTAHPGIDFAPTSGTLSWSAGQTEKTVTVPLVSPVRASGDRYFDFVLSNPSSAVMDTANSRTRVTLLAAGEATANRIFGWAETVFPELFWPVAQTENLEGSLFYRYYSGTGNYLGVQESRVLFLGAGESAIWDVGPYDDWMNLIIQDGY